MTTTNPVPSMFKSATKPSNGLTKTVWTLNINEKNPYQESCCSTSAGTGYAPEITEMTYPLLKHFAKKIGADFRVISERCYPEYPVVYEKFQIYDLGEASDWNIFIDSDALVHPDTFDPTEHLTKDTVMHNGSDLAGCRIKYDNYFRRDGRHIGSCTWFVVCSNWCLDIWHPLEDITLEEALGNIFPTQEELRTVITREHLIDDYLCSRNIARYGLKFTTFQAIIDKLQDNGNYLWHQYTIPVEEKVKSIKEILKAWKL